MGVSYKFKIFKDQAIFVLMEKIINYEGGGEKKKKKNWDNFIDQIAIVIGLSSKFMEEHTILYEKLKIY